ncbi:MAG TPA: gamma-glutamyl-gamma-aminobutyrate hydrolase family protein [Pseudothermotoga sp.]
MKPKIGITCSIDENSIKLNEAYYKALEKAGAIPLLIPIYEDSAIVNELAGSLDGVLFSGGVDIDPHHYGEEPKKSLGQITPKRDELEINLCQVFFMMKKPIFGICRGIQLINVALGGNLYQDIYTQRENVLKHSQDAPSYHPTHKVRLIQGSFIQKLFGKFEIAVNSFHHQAIKETAPILKPVAYSEDGIIEAVENVDENNFILAVQWHPERMFEKYQEQMRLFEVFVEWCTNHGRR